MPITGFEIAALKTAWDLATKHLEQADVLRRNDAEACGEYLQAAMEAILGLENARIELLSEAKWLEASDDLAKAKADLQTRLEKFFRERKLLPVLIKAQARIRACADALQQDNNTFFRSRGSAGQRRRELVHAIQQELDNVIAYISRLQSELANGLTAPGIYGLMRLQVMLTSASPQVIREHASRELELRGNIDSEYFRVVGLISDLNLAFR